MRQGVSRHQRNDVDGRHQGIDLGRTRRLLCDQNGISLRLDLPIAYPPRR